jgi:hypothetical protein
MCGIGLVPVAYLCGREIVSRLAGALVAAFVAFSPFMIWYSQEARSYMLFALLCGGSLLFAARSWRVASTRNLVLWGACSAGAVATHFFAGFLIAPEALLVLYRARSRTMALASGAVALVQLAVLPLAIGDTSHPLGWINQFPLSVRIKQVPVDFSLSSLYQSPLVNKGLIGALVLAAVTVGLIVVWGGSLERRGAAFAGAIAGFVLLAPLVLAVLGSDYLVARNLTPAWIPLAVVIAAACTVPRARVAGALLAVLMLGTFVYGESRIERQTQYQRPDWRGIAQILGPARAQRAIVAYDGAFASVPLSVYLRGVPWQQPPPQPVAVSEVDVVGSTWQTVPRPLPAGVRLVGTAAVSNLLVERFSVTPGWRLVPSEIAARARGLLGPAPPSPVVLIQRPGGRTA